MQWMYPACHLPVLLRSARERYLVIHIVAIHKVLQNGSALPDVELLAILVDVGDSRDATVWVDVEEPLLFLLMLEELDLAHLHKIYVRVAVLQLS